MQTSEWKMSIVGTLRDVTIYGGVISFVLWQWSRMGTYTWRNDANVPLQPPSWVFSVVWPVLYGLLSASWIVAIYNFAEDNISTAIYALYATNVILTKLWTLTAGDWDRPRWAFLVMLGVVGTAIANAVLLGVAGLWVSFGLYIPYVAWLAVAGFWNLYYAFVLNVSMVVSGMNPLNMSLLQKKRRRTGLV